MKYKFVDMPFIYRHVRTLLTLAWHGWLRWNPIGGKEKQRVQFWIVGLQFGSCHKKQAIKGKVFFNKSMNNIRAIGLS